MKALPVVLSIDEAQNLCVLCFDPPMLRRVKQLLRARGAVSKMRFPFQAAAHWVELLPRSGSSWRPSSGSS